MMCSKQGSDPRVTNRMGEDAQKLVRRLAGDVPATMGLLLDLLAVAKKMYVLMPFVE